MPLHFRLLLSKLLTFHLHSAEGQINYFRNTLLHFSFAWHSRVVLVLDEVELLLDPLKGLVDARHAFVVGGWTTTSVAAAALKLPKRETLRC